jgi:hypothetical protein
MGTRALAVEFPAGYTPGGAGSRVFENDQAFLASPSLGRLKNPPDRSLRLNLNLVVYCSKNSCNGVGHRNAILLSSVSEPERDSVVVPVLAAGNQLEWNLGHGVVSDFLLHALVGIINLNAHTVFAQLSGNTVEVLAKLIGDWNSHYLYRR